jgi:hypothetical protein
VGGREFCLQKKNFDFFPIYYFENHVSAWGMGTVFWACIEMSFSNTQVDMSIPMLKSRFASLRSFHNCRKTLLDSRA